MTVDEDIKLSLIHISMPKYGTFNVHAALLPQYRGAAPINWAVINGEKETGVTTVSLIHILVFLNDILHAQQGERSLVNMVGEQLASSSCR